MNKQYYFFSVYLLFISAIIQSQILQTTGSLHVPRDGAESQVMANGKVIVFGGTDGFVFDPHYYKSAEIYSPVTKTWAFTDSMSKPRKEFTSAILNDGRILAIGGSDSISYPLKSCEWYNPATAKWTAAASLNTARSGHKAVVMRNGNVLVVGGDDESAELFDPVSNKWTYVAALNLKHGAGLCLTRLTTGKILIVGGTTNATVAELYDPATGVWVTLPSLIVPRIYSSCVTLTDGRVLIYGTSISGYETTCEIYDPVTNSFKITGFLNVGRVHSPGILLDNGNVLTYGYGEIASNTKVIETFDPVKENWFAGSYTTIGGFLYGINKLQTGEILISGGISTTGNGSNATCFLIKPEEASGCTAPNVSYSVTATPSAICFGKDGVVKLSAYEPGVTYKAFINTIPVSAAVTNGNIIIPAGLLAIGKNIIRISAFKNGCNAMILTDTAQIIVTQNSVSKTKITTSGPLSSCKLTPAILTAATTSNGYWWSTDETTRSISLCGQSV
jgi:hypothetical protein